MVGRDGGEERGRGAVSCADKSAINQVARRNDGAGSIEACAVGLSTGRRGMWKELHTFHGALASGALCCDATRPRRQAYRGGVPATLMYLSNQHPTTLIRWICTKYI